MKFTNIDSYINIIKWMRESNYPLVDGCSFLDSLGSNGPEIKIATLGGLMTGKAGDYILKGVQGEFYPCKEDIFQTTYEILREGQNNGN